MTFGSAFLLLFRCATGENWNILMHELSKTGEINGVQCIENQTYEDIIKNGEVRGCGSPLSYAYFITFMITISMMIMNLFVAVVLEGFSSSSKENLGVVTSDHYTKLTQTWSEFDPKATGFITAKKLVFLIYSLPKPLGKKELYHDLLKTTTERYYNIAEGPNRQVVAHMPKFVTIKYNKMILPNRTMRMELE